jgi:3-oxoacyl-[acyl-carrier protein] reductase
MLNVIVTGGSRGLGLGTALRLVCAGYRVIAIARNSNSKLAEAMHESEAAHPGAFQFVQFDLTEISGIQGLVRGLRKEFGPIYGLVNNAGISFDGPLAMMPVTHIEQLIQTNTLSPIVLTKYVTRAMMADGGGRVVNISSITAVTGYSGLVAYGATKSAVIGFTRALAREVGCMGINVNAVAPGFVETDMTVGLKGENLQRITRRSALRRLPEVGDIATAIEFLMGPGAKNITGTVLTVDAGNTA